MNSRYTQSNNREIFIIAAEKQQAVPTAMFTSSDLDYSFNCTIQYDHPIF